tara:strand:+ start:547 stop:1026 length:480 start_codon:yes stop_codon:yes gene_type:complete
VATPTYVPLGTFSVSTNTVSVTFSSIDQSYGDLCVAVTGKSFGSNLGFLQLNSGTSNDYVSAQALAGTGIETTSGNSSVIRLGNQTFGTDINNLVAHIMDYSETDRYKNVLSSGSNGAELNFFTCAIWKDTSAVTSVKVDGDFASGTNVSLYGIAKVVV